MIDRYTKSVLTVIAAALCVIAVQQFTPSAVAAFPTGREGCGDYNNPCYIEASSPLLVRIFP